MSTDSMQDLFEPAADGASTELHASTCNSCARTHFPAVDDCPACGGTVHSERLTTGRLSARTEVTAPPPGALVEPPYAVGIADFDSGIRVIGLVDAGTAVGDDVSVVVRRYHSNRTTFAFRNRTTGSEVSVNRKDVS
ncbi:hypothetical protein DK926_03600 [Rhodococcus sp. Eu-32]|uniref:Zn-ribbon domain-containing OB-fold protein n=1 Tax=Rhodococcus sp. Eu-32 TaxID=1017319 RepID=UPI000DF38280|nr:OB-fold domain-containing protein [Rhodococcus sp. Eu-32]RRQ28998.1 hypothetical protein DK926_03600 [Rhodococcus sp. Eu-32]